MKYMLTLSRWHKVAERINNAVKERENTVKAAFNSTVISPWNKDGVEEKALNIVRRASEDLKLIEIGTATVAAIRSALALQNAQSGISARLSEAEAANRRATLYKAVIDGQKSDMVRPQAVRDLPDLAGEAEDLGYLRRGAPVVTLQTADSEVIGSLRKKLEREQVRANRLLDEVADLNREKLEIDIPQEVITIAGLPE
jgi:hypothetical protein